MAEGRGLTVSFDLVFPGAQGDTEEGRPTRTIVHIMKEPATQEVMCSSWQSDTDAPPQSLVLPTLGTGMCVLCVVSMCMCVCTRVSTCVYVCVRVLVRVRRLFVCACVRLLCKRQACVALIAAHSFYDRFCRNCRCRGG